jgi:prepilin-type N-terminal cleavage/methylation domain-containing protein
MDTNRNIQHPASNIQHRRGFTLVELPAVSTRKRFAFTLVELLVVITIIGILAALIVTAAVGAMGKAQETRIKAEINQLDAALREYKNKNTAFPPNCQTDDTNLTVEPDSSPTPINELQVFNDLKKHLKQVAPRHQESDDLLRVIAGLPAQDTARYNKILAGGISAGEAIVFWLGGFSSDPKYPISGEGGPSYPGTAAAADPIESRKWVFPFEVTRLAPRTDDKFFDEEYERFIIYTDPKGIQRRINFWQYTPRGSEQPYLYFDTSRYQPIATMDPPAATDPADMGFRLHVHAFKKQGDANTLQFINPDGFQVMHSGRDDEWDETAFEDMSVHNIASTDPADYLLFPDGPFIGEIADTIVNFAEQTRIEDAQP